MVTMKLLYLTSFASLAVANGPGWDWKPRVHPKVLPQMIHLWDLLQGAQQLEDFAYAYPERNRVFGGRAHEDTVNYLYRELKKTGYYDVYKQPQVHQWTRADQALTVDGQSYDATTMTYSPSVNATAPLAVVNNLGCVEADYPADLTGKIALISRGECTFATKSVLSAKAGAAAALVYNNIEGSMAGTLGGATSELGAYAPIAGISLADGQALIQMIQAGTVTANLWIDSQVENRTTYNVIAQTKGGDPNNVVALGGHTDSVEAGPGINDDGSGIISNLVVAKALTRFSVKNAVRFCFWTAEEFGLLGSNYYVNSLNATEQAKIRLYLNFDMIASPNYALMIYDGDGSAFNLTGPAGSAQIERLFEDYYTSIRKPFVPTEFNGRSDYQAFILNGIPAGGLFTGAEAIKTEEQAQLFGGQAGVALDANYHAKGDNMTNLNREAFLINSRATAFAVATYANTQLEQAMKRTPHTHTGGTGCYKDRVEQ
ncbi:Leucyl aminopeptidase yscIV [Aspergillus fumigatus]|nr:Leucyl aminopeptidase yscIV [Aspergillus fumigatus]